MRTVALALLALLLVTGCSSGSAETAPAAAPSPQDAFVAEVLAAAPGLTDGLSRTEIITAGRNACTSIGTQGVTQESLSDIVDRQLNAQVGSIVVTAAARTLCPDREFSDEQLPPFDFVGSISLQDPEGHVPGPGGVGCQGNGGYADLRPGAAVTVQDAAGTVVAVGAVSLGVPNGEACDLYFEVTDVPPSAFYQVEVASRGAVTYTEEQARGGEVMLTIGG